MDLNRATIVGRLTRDPESRTTPSGAGVVSFGVATNSVWKDRATGEKREAVEFHNIVIWGKLGEIAAQYCHKGSRVLIEGRLQTRTWDGQDGTKKNRTEIVADNLIMLDSKGSAGAGAAPVARPAAQSQEDEIFVEEPAPPREPKTDLSSVATSEEGAKEEEISLEDIPF